ncbi:MAG: hypothetical protein ICV63_08785 [Coleofasciculus sp. Co-bin14]|nr:hypothetical protein [Coleofasciculus sp. Co-bin14]
MSIQSIIAACRSVKLTVPQTAYVLATVKHETAATYEPIEEWASGDAYEWREDLGNTQPGDGRRFKGRGAAQITGRRNYKVFSELLGIDLENYPERALEEEISDRILILGMTRGLFTGRKLADYINDGECDYYNARRIINGLDKADTIAEYALQWEKELSSPQLKSIMNSAVFLTLHQTFLKQDPHSAASLPPERKIELPEGIYFKVLDYQAVGKHYKILLESQKIAWERQGIIRTLSISQGEWYVY